MASHSRSSKFIQHRVASNGAVLPSQVFNQVVEHLSETFRGGRTSDVVHRKMLAPGDGSFTKYGVLHLRQNAGHGGDSIDLSPHTAVVQRHYSESFGLGALNNNNFEILPFLADLDGTIAMFSQKFIRNLSYGSVTWGIMPFVSDVQSLINSLRDLSGKYKTYPRCQRVSTRRPILFERPIEDARHPEGVNALLSIFGYSHVNGYLTRMPVNIDAALGRAQFLLDELGFHPDLKTLWDVIPLSFVVDYFLPIGDILESLHPRGWGSSTYTFNGFCTTKVKYRCCYKLVSDNGTYDSTAALWQEYKRTYVSGGFQPSEGFDFKSPSLKEIFNTAYLTNFLLRNVESGLLHRKSRGWVFRPR